MHINPIMQFMNELFARKVWSDPAAVAASTGLSVRNPSEGGAEESDSEISRSTNYFINRIIK